MEVGEESSECGFPVNRCYEFPVRACDINVWKGEIFIFFDFRCESYVRKLLVEKIEVIAQSGNRSYKRPSILYTQDDIDCLNDLNNDTTIAIMKPYEGNGIVILNKEDYNKKMDDILPNITKIELLYEDPFKTTLQRKAKRNCY